MTTRHRAAKLLIMKLNDRIKSAIGSTDVDLTPKPREPKAPKKVEGPVLPIEHVFESVIDCKRITQLVLQSVECKAAESVAKAARKPLTAQLKRMIPVGTRFMVGENKVNNFTGVRKSISATKLLELGVSSATILAATVETTTNTLKITLPGEKEYGEDED